MSSADHNERSRSRSPSRRDSVDSPADPPQARSTEDPTNTGTNLFVSNLATDVTDQILEEHFSKYGKVERSQVMTDPRSRESRGFGFVNYSTPAEADAALTADGSELNGKRITVQKARRARPRTPTPGEYRGPPKERHGVDRRGGYDYRRDFDDRRGGYDYRREYYDRRFGYDDRRGGYDYRREYDRREFDRRGGYDYRREFDRRGGYDERDRRW